MNEDIMCGLIPHHAIAPLKEHCSTHLTMTTTRTRKPKMNEQHKPSIHIKTVPAHALDLTLISRDSLFDDMKKRTRLHNYEVAEAMSDLKDMVTWTRSQLTKTK